MRSLISIIVFAFFTVSLVAHETPDSSLYQKQLQTLTEEVDNLEKEVNINSASSIANRGTGTNNRKLIDAATIKAKDFQTTTEATLSENSKQLEIAVGAIKALENDITAGEEKVQVSRTFIDKFWVLICAALVFFMQAGFTVFEVGMVREKHRNAVGIKNILDFIILTIVFYFVGFPIMFGESAGGLIGTSLWLPSQDSMNQYALTHDMIPLRMEFFLYQLVFASAAATIVSGAMAGRTHLIGYLAIAAFIGLFIYPVFGHQAWGASFISSNKPLLATFGFRDFAGSTVVHSIGAWVALAGVIIVRERNGRFVESRKAEFKSNNLGYSVLGLFILWLGWWGFNGGSNLQYDDLVSKIILNLSLAAAAGGLIAFLDAFIRDPESIYEKFLGGVLGGLVAITACCNMVTPLQSLLIGVVAAWVHNWSFDYLLRKRLDDPIGAIPVHGFCGVWGTLCVAIFGDLDTIKDMGDTILSDSSSVLTQRLVQLGIQSLGIIIGFLFAFGLSWFFIKAIHSRWGIRLKASDEREGNYFNIKSKSLERLRSRFGKQKSTTS